MADGRTPVMFIGREHELAALNKLYASDKFEFVVYMAVAVSAKQR